MNDVSLKTLKMANENAAGWEAKARMFRSYADSADADAMEQRRRAQRYRKALEFIENEACGDSEWTPERLHEALEAVWQKAREVLASPSEGGVGPR